MAYAIVNSGDTRDDSGSSYVDVTSWALGAGNDLLYIAWGGSGGATFSPSGPTGTFASIGVQTGGSYGTMQAWLLEGTTAETPVRFRVTKTAGPDQYPLTLWVVEISGLDDTPILDYKFSEQTNPGTADDAVTTGNMGTLASQPAMIIALSAEYNNVAAATAGTGFTSLSPVWTTARPQHKRVTATTAVAGTWKAANATDDFISVVIALAEPASTQSNAPRAAAYYRMMRSR